MKIKWRQEMLREQKRRLSKNKLFYRPANNDGIYAYHCYDDPKEISYWDDFSFIYGGRKISVCWIHPRMKYIDMVEDDFHKNNKFPGDGGVFENSTKVYKKVGKSRKKIKYYRTSEKHNSDEHRRKLYDYWYRMELATHISPLVAEESISIKNYHHAQMVYVCLGVEVTREKDLAIMRDFVLNYLKNRPVFTSLYKYDCVDYTREHGKDRLEKYADWTLESNNENMVSFG